MGLSYLCAKANNRRNVPSSRNYYYYNIYFTCHIPRYIKCFLNVSLKETTLILVLLLCRWIYMPPVCIYLFLCWKENYEVLASIPLDGFQNYVELFDSIANISFSQIDKRGTQIKGLTFYIDAKRLFVSIRSKHLQCRCWENCWVLKRSYWWAL